ncbi:MAG: 30S ribosomal protein S6 [Clostridia bacterium]|nr:30S ribosomal protein S6 [Clostridia bacterium]
MKTYEIMYVVDNAVSDEAKEAVQAKFENLIRVQGGNVVSVDQMGAKKLAYPIDHKTEGYYVVITYEGDGSFNRELDRVVSLTSEVIRRKIMTKE